VLECIERWYFLGIKMDSIPYDSMSLGHIQIGIQAHKNLNVRCEWEGGGGWGAQPRAQKA
jgi:hypothetical protein